MPIGKTHSTWLVGSFDSVKDTPMKADKSNPEKDRRIGRILMFITFWTSIILFRAFYCIFMVCLRLTVIRLTYWKSKKSFWQSITVTLHQTKKCKNKLLMGELSLSFNFTRFVCSNAKRDCIWITRADVIFFTEKISY